MIVESMTPTELTRELLRDRENIFRKVQYLEREVERARIKSKDKSFAVKIFDYKSPLKNNWILIFRKTKKGAALTMIAYTKGKVDFYMLCTNDVVEHFTKHFLERYRERYLKDETLSIVETMKRFALRNDQSMSEIKVNTENEFQCLKVDGLSFGVLEETNQSAIFHECTFITMDMVKEKQMDKVIDLGLQLAQFKKDMVKQYGNAVGWLK